MAWFRWYEGAATDPKFHLISRKSGQPVAYVVAVWAMLLERASAAEDRGSIAGFDCESVDAVLGMPDGTAEMIVVAMEDKGMLCNERVAKWDTRQPKREDASSTERSRECRARKKADAAQCNDVQRDATQCNTLQQTATQSNEVQRDATLDKSRVEEKRGEEEKKKKAEECTEQDKPAQCRRPKKSSELLPATEFALPLNTGELWYVPQADYDSWCQLYPGVDVAQALRSMRGWCDSNPKRRKTKNGIKAFCTSWLSRDQNGQSQKQAQQPMAKNQYYPGQPACPTEYQLREQEQRLMAEALLADMEARGDTYKQRHANDDDDGKQKLSTYDLMEIVAGR